MDPDRLGRIGKLGLAASLLLFPFVAILNSGHSQPLHGPIPDRQPGLVHQIEILGADDRRAANLQEQKAYSALGLLVNSNGDGGTATVTEARDVLTTAAHLFYEKGKLIEPVENYTFYLPELGERERSFAEYKVKSVVAGTMFPEQEPWFDFAVVRLERPVKEQITPVTFLSSYNDARPRSGDKVIMPGFHGDDASVLRVSIGKTHEISSGAIYPFRRMADKLIITDYDAVGGSSGSPIFNEAGQFIAVNFGSYCQKTGPIIFNNQDCFNIGTRLGREYKRVLEKFVGGPAQISAKKTGPMIQVGPPPVQKPTLTCSRFGIQPFGPRRCVN